MSYDTWKTTEPDIDRAPGEHRHGDEECDCYECEQDRPVRTEVRLLRDRLARIEPVMEAAKAFHQLAAKSATDVRYRDLLAGTGDWACEKCRPWSDMLVAGFRCVPHALKDAIDAALAEKEQG